MRPSPQTVLASVTRLSRSKPQHLLRQSNRRNNNPGSRLLVVSCTRSPNIPNEAPNAGVVEAFRAWERSRMSTLACSGNSARSVAPTSSIKTGEERVMESSTRETRFGVGNWFLRQRDEDAGCRRRRAPLTGGVPVPVGLAMAMALSSKVNSLKPRERNLSGITLMDEETEQGSRRSSVSKDDWKRELNWLPLC